MMKRIILLLLLCLVPSKEALSYGVWPLSAVTSSAPAVNGSGVRVALIDTGISSKYLNTTRIEAGHNYVYPERGTDDLVGHGTAIAGILLGSEDMALKGIAPGVILVPLTVYTRNAGGSAVSGGSNAITQAIYDAVDEYNCSIINLSAGLAAGNDKLHAAVDYAEAQGVTVVSSVGNDNLTTPKRVYYPAAYDTVIGVGAIGNNGRITDFSQRNESVFLVAPGKDLRVAAAWNGKRSSTSSGTSYATAFVTGAAALLLSTYPGLPAAKVRQYLSSSALDIEAQGYDSSSGWGVVQLDRALAYAADKL